MKLDANTISQFVKMTRDDNNRIEPTSMYGEVVIVNDLTHVRLDGSDVLIPIDSTVHVKDGERVAVTIVDHKAVIDGNVSDISASNDLVLNIDGNVEDIEDVIDYVFIDNLEQVKKLDGRVVTLEDSLNVISAEIQTKTTLDDVNLAITDRLDGTSILGYVYESMIEVNAVGTTVVTLPTDIPPKTKNNYAVILSIKSYSFNESWDNLITQKAIVYHSNKTTKNFTIVTDITALDITNSVKATKGKAIIKYTIIG